MDDVVTSIYTVLDQEKTTQNNVVVSEDVVELNDKAVACMLKNDFQGALEILQVGLARVMSLQAQPQATNPTATSTMPQHPFRDESPIASIPLTRDVNSVPFDGIFVFFNRALLIPHHCDFDLSCPKNRSRALATILYNIALVYHMEAIKRGDSTIFRHALSYYGWAYYVIESSAGQFGFQDVLLLLLALFNNMGHIHSSVFVNGEKTQQCLRWMQSTFAGKAIKRALFPEDYKFFFQYISMMSNRQMQLAPAA